MKKGVRIAESTKSNSATGMSYSGVIHFDVDNIRDLTAVGRFSSKVEVGGLPWCVHVSNEVMRGDRFLMVSFFCAASRSVEWSMEVSAMFILHHEDELNIQQPLKFHHTSTNRGIVPVPWRGLMSDVGFVTNDSIKIEVRFSASHLKGIQFIPPKITELTLHEKPPDFDTGFASIKMELYTPGFPPPYVLSRDLSSVDLRLIKPFLSKPIACWSDTLFKELSPVALTSWCTTSTARVLIEWDAEKGSTALQSLKIFPHRDVIIESIQKAHVTVVIAPTGTGKTMMGPLLLAELVRLSDERGEVSTRGLTVSPSGDHAGNAIKQCEKLYMTSSSAFCEIVNYCNPFELVPCSLAKEMLASGVESTVEHAFTTYRGALNALESFATLKLLQVDEVHATKPELLTVLALARRLVDKKCVEKLLLTSATLDNNELEGLRCYFAESGLTMEVVDLYEKLQTKGNVAMSCARYESGANLADFHPTPFSTQLTEDYGQGVWPRDRPQRLEPFGSEERKAVPVMKEILPYVKQAVHRAMEEATRMLEEGVMGSAMPSILVLVPGKEHADRLKSDIEGSPASFTYYKYKDTDEPAFTLTRLRLGSGRKTEEEKFDDEKEISALSKLSLSSADQNEVEKTQKNNELPEEMRGPWGGRKGSIIFSTPHATEGMTMKDIVFVIDSGVVRVPAAYSLSGLRSLVFTWMDKRMIYQRAGRCGRTINGEYFICASGSKVHQLLNVDLKDMLFTRNFDELAWIHAKQLGCFDELIWKPPVDLTNDFRKSFMIRGCFRNGGFTDEASLLHSYFSFLTPEHARFLVMGVRLGIAAHAICYVAESIVSDKLFRRLRNIPENFDFLAETGALDLYSNVCSLLTWKGKQIRPFDLGDSVTMADMMITWLRHKYPTTNVETEPDFDKYEGPMTDRKWKELEVKASKAVDGVFWAGRWFKGTGEKRDQSIGMKELQKMVIREDGRESLLMTITQVVRACQRLSLIVHPNGIASEGSFLSPRYNRYLRAKDNYNLSEDGRALFRALLTMNSNKLASANSRTSKAANGETIHLPSDRFSIYVDTHAAEAHIYPERREWKHREDKSTSKFVRFWEGFTAIQGQNFIGTLDPLTIPQIAFFLNAFGMLELHKEGVLINLNASPKGHIDGVSIRMDEEVSSRVWKVRESLQKSTDRILKEKDETFDSVARSIIALWKGLDDGVESSIKLLPQWEHYTTLLDLTFGVKTLVK